MKLNSFNPFTIAFVFVLAVTTTSCSSDYTAKSLHGKWQVTSMNADMPEVSPAIIKSGEELALSTIYEFNEDGTSTETSSFYPDGIPGKWTYNADSLTLHILSTDDAIPSEAQYDVLFHSKRKITLTQNYDELGSLVMEVVKLK